MSDVDTPTDVDVLTALSTRDQIRIVERLGRGPARQAELVKDLKLQSGSVSRWLAEFRELTLVTRSGERRNGTYSLVEPDATADLLDAAATLADKLAASGLKAAEARRQANAARLEERQQQRRASRKR